MSLQVVVDTPSLPWTLTAMETPALRILNPISAALPVATWRPRPLVRSRELLARALGMGDMRMSGTMPSGHTGTLMPQRAVGPAILKLCLRPGTTAAMPLATWRPHLLVRSRELLARALGMGAMRLSGVMPSGHVGTLMPRRMHFIERSTAVLEGVDLGAPAHVKENPKIGDAPLPSRGILATGGAAWRIADRAEYERTRAQTGTHS